MKTVIDNLGGVGSNIKLLTPTFNMSEPDFVALYSAFRADPNTQAVRGRLTGTIGNAYNVSGQTVGYWVDRINSAGGPIGEMHLAEAGRFPPDPVPENLISAVATESGITLTSANLFNVFNNNEMFSHHALSDDEIHKVCGGNCGNIGVNFAGGFNSSSYIRAANLNLGYMVGIVSGMGDVGAVVGAANAGFIPIVRIGSGDCTSSGAGEFEDAAKYATFIKAVASAVGGKTVYFIVGPNEPDVEQWWAGNYGTKTNCGCSSTGGGGWNIGEVVEPDCPASPYRLTIKGTIKSSNVFMQSTDPLTGEKVFTDVRNTSAVMGQDAPYVKNVPVNGAVIQLHDSQKLDHHTSHTNSPGMVDGMLKQPYASITTKPDGTFIINAQSHCEKGGNVYRSDWRGTGYEQYLSISCADQLVGEAEPRMVVKDVLGYVLDLQGTDEEIEVNLGDINVDCQAVPWKMYPGVARPTNLISFAPRSKEVFLSCSGANRITRSGLESYKYQPWDMDLIFKDTWSQGGILGDLAGLLDLVGTTLFGGEPENRWGDWLRTHVPFNGRTEVRTAPQTKLYSMEEHSILIDSLLGIRGGTLEDGGAVPIPKYYQEGAPAGVQTYNNYEEKPVLVNCESFKRCSNTLSEERYPLDNAQTCGGMWNNLAPPFGGVVRDGGGNVDLYLSADIIRYQRLPKERKVCLGFGGQEVLVRDIMPLPGFCGDLNGDGVVAGEAGGEMPCPERFDCGDQDGDGVVNVAVDEIPCAAVSVESNTPGEYNAGGTYKYDIRYFPYSMLYNSDVYNLSEAQSETTRASNDSFSSYCPRGYSEDGGYQQAEDASGNTKPSVRGCIEDTTGALTFYSQTETKYPCTDWTCFKKNENLETVAYSEVNPVPATLLGTPSFINSINSREVVQRSIEQMVQTVIASEKGHFFRLGIPDDLCTCSLVEDGSNSSVPSLRDCVQTDASVLGSSPPETNDPGNLFSPVRDEIIGEGDRHLAADFPGVNFGDPDNASKVAGGADWEGLAQGTIAPEVKTADSDRFKHYEQETEISGSFLDSLIEAAECVFRSEVSDPATEVYDGGAVCDRELRLVAKNVGLSRGTLPDLLKNGLLLLNAIDPPAVQVDQVLIRSAGLIDRTMTKPERRADGNPWGFDTSQISSSSTVPGSQGSGYIYDYGVGKKIQRDKFMNLVSTPVFTGLESPACRTVEGWQVKNVGYGLFAVDCTDDGINCWAGGGIKDEANWQGPTLIETSINAGLDWQENQYGSGFVLGLGVYNGTPLGAGQYSRISLSGSWGFWQPRLPLLRAGKLYDSHLYSIARSNDGYLATGTGHVFFSANGAIWRDIAGTDRGEYPVGCEDPTYPYGCDPDVPDACWNKDQTGLVARGVCDYNSATPDIPYCPNCWKWGSGSVYGVDCNSLGDCIVVTSRAPRALWATAASSKGDFDSWTRVDLAKQVGPTAWEPTTESYVLDVSFPDQNVAYAVGGASDGGDAQGGFIVKTTDKGRGWSNLVVNYADSGFRGIDCFDKDHCAVAGNHGVVLISKLNDDGSITWTDWEDMPEWAGDPLITEAKSADIRFQDISYPNEHTIVVVGFKPVTPGSSEVTGVIYSLGEREDCGEISGGDCQSSPASCPSSSQGTAVWRNGTSAFIGGPGDVDILATYSGSTVKVTGTIEFGDPFTANASLGYTQKFVANPCQKSAGRGCPIIGSGLLIAVPSLEIIGPEGVYKYGFKPNCPFNVGKVEINLDIPQGYIYKITGSQGHCSSPVATEQITATASACYRGYVWSQVPGHTADITICNETINCSNIFYDGDDYIKQGLNNPGCRKYCDPTGVNLDASGNCYACGFFGPDKVGFHNCF
ncbi:hypothetical protein KKG63_02535 [Patescibacteria group bacterium]|nr:hypothetical protein [Patescibacteria group bacterium]